MDQNQEPSASLPNTFVPIEQLPEPVLQPEMPVSAVQQVELNDEHRQHAVKKLRRYGIIGLVIGVIVLIGLFLPFILFSGKNNNAVASGIVDLMYALVYTCVRIGGMIICAILLVLSLVNIKKYKLGFSKYVAMTIVGLLLTLSPYVRTVIIKSDPFRITAGDMSVFDCNSSARRASNEHWSDADSLGGDPEYIAEDIACSYLEYFYDNSEEPSSSAQLSQYYQAYNVKNGIATVTINANQPNKANIYNIITHRSCGNYKNDSAISVWFRVEEKNNGVGCVDVIASEYLDDEDEMRFYDLYNLKESKEWLEWQFKEEITSDEARELIESKRKASNDDTWSTGAVRIVGKSKDGYYWIEYEEIKSNGITVEPTLLFHRENGIWVFEAPKSDNDFNKHDFEDL